MKLLYIKEVKSDIYTFNAFMNDSQKLQALATSNERTEFVGHINPTHTELHML